MKKQTMTSQSTTLQSTILQPSTDKIGQRIDIFLSQALNLSRNKIENLIQQNQILLNNLPLKKNGILLKQGDVIHISATKTPKKRQNANFSIPILYEDEDFIVINKPIHLLTHRINEKSEEFTLVDYLLQKGFKLSNLGDSYRSGIIHRLDRGTSGAMVIAKNNKSHKLLSIQLQSRSMGRYYLCVIDKILKENIILQSPLIRHPKNRLKYLTSTPENPHSKSAKSAFFKIIDNAQTELIGAKLFSGRTHQIRVHLASLNRHILGDTFYGYQGSYSKRILLHAHLLYLIHPKSNQPLRFYAPLEENMRIYLQDNLYYKPILEDFKLPLEELYEQSFKNQA